MCVPNKVKHFAWRACIDILVTKENLWKRRITKDNLCEAYGKGPESACHIFWLYDNTKEVWLSSKLILPFEINPILEIHRCDVEFTKVVKLMP